MKIRDCSCCCRLHEGSRGGSQVALCFQCALCPFFFKKLLLPPNERDISIVLLHFHPCFQMSPRSMPGLILNIRLLNYKL